MSYQFTFRATQMALASLAAASTFAYAQVSLPSLPALVRGVSGDTWADIELGQRDFTEIGEGMVGPNRVKQPAGIAIDRSVSPGRIYIWDSGNNRIVGMELATCYASAGPCTATLVIGQPSLIDHGACNLDSSFQTFPDRPSSSASTLCGVSEGTFTALEDKSYAGLYVDGQGNLWVPDVRNHRVLKYNSPFTSNVVADDVWGQADFSGNGCNRHTVFYGTAYASELVAPDATTLCFGEVAGGVTLDAGGNLWVADTGNSRVLRFPNIAGVVAKTADVVIGQPDFTSATPGSALDRLATPSQIRFDPAGNLLVLDSLDGQSNARVLRFRPPFRNGMSGQEIYSCPDWDNTLSPPNCRKPPTAIEVDTKRNGLWIVIADGDGWVALPRLYNFDGTLRSALTELGPGGLGWPVNGSLGIDSNGDVIFSASRAGEDVLRIHEDTPGHFTAMRTLFVSDSHTNVAAAERVQHAAWGGVAVAGSQVIVADGRLLFWNNRISLTNGQKPDGYVGATSFTDVPNAQLGEPEHGQVKTDKDLRVWVTHTNEGAESSEVLLYQGPLTTGAAPLKSLRTIPVLGGGSITLVSAYGIAVTDHSEYLWIAEPTRHHVIRVRGPLTATPVVDVILGQRTFSGSEQCNMGLTPESPVAPLNALCYPGAISLDRKGNLFVSDHYIEVRGNRRLLMFAPLPAPASAPILAPSAAKLFPPTDGHDFATFEPAFDSGNRMVVGVNPYFSSRFLNIYDFPTALNAANPADPEMAHADAQLSDFYGWPVGMTFDSDDNLYAYDANRKLLIYHRPLANRPTLALKFPIGGEALPAGTAVTVRWLSAANVGNVDIEYQPVGSTAWQKIATSVPNTGAFKWTTPTATASQQGRLRVIAAVNPSLVATSAAFTLTTSLTVLYPNGGETLTSYSIVHLKWVSAAGIGNVNLDLWNPESKTWEPVAHDVPNTGDYRWMLLAVAHRGTSLRVSSAADPRIADVSDAPFDIVTKINWTFSPLWRCTSGVPNPAAIHAHWEYMVWPPSPQVWKTAPIDTPLVVHSDSLQSNGYLTMVTDDGVTEYLQPYANPAIPAMEVLPPFLRPVATFRFGSGGYAGIPRLFFGSFSAGFYLPARMCQPAAAAAEALAPATGEVVSGNSSYTVRWTMAPNAGDTVSIELSTDNGATWTTVAAAAPNTGTFALTLPNTPTTGARVRVSSTTDLSISTIGAPFTIQAAKPHHHHRHRHHKHHHADDDERSGSKRPHHHESDRDNDD